eukprot:IDg15958t1
MLAKSQPIENGWGLLVCAVYHNFRLFDYLDDLCETIINEWDTISQQTLLLMENSMPAQCAAVRMKRGGPTCY